MTFHAQARAIRAVARSAKEATNALKEVAVAAEESKEKLSNIERGMRDALLAFQKEVKETDSAITGSFTISAALLQHWIDAYRKVFGRDDAQSGLERGNIERLFDQFGGRKKFKDLGINDLFRRGILK